jgi:hypothetical protein
MLLSLNNVASQVAGTVIPVGHAEQNLVIIYSTAGAAGTTVTVESSLDGSNWVTELSIAAPTATPVATTHRVYIPATQFIRGNVTVWAAGNVFCQVQSWNKSGVPIN